MLILIPIVPRATPAGSWSSRSLIAGRGLGLLVSQLNNYTLSPISEERVSEAAGVNSAAGRSGCPSAWRSPARSCWRRSPSPSPTWPNSSTVLTRVGAAAGRRQSLEHDAEIMSNTALQKQLAGEPKRRRTRSSGSTPTRGTSRCRSRSWCRSCALPGRPPELVSGWCASPSRRRPPRSRASAWADARRRRSLRRRGGLTVGSSVSHSNDRYPNSRSQPWPARRMSTWARSPSSIPTGHVVERPAGAGGWDFLAPRWSGARTALLAAFLFDLS